MACSMLILLWVQDEKSIDGFHANGKQLFQVYERNFYDGRIEAGYSTQGLLADELKRAVPEIQYSSGMDHASPPGALSTFEADNKSIKMDGSFVGTDFFNMFSFPLLQGTAQSALSAPESVAISRRMAEQFFGSPEKAIGKSIRYENKDELLVTAVFENVSSQSSLQFDFLRPWQAFVKENAWVNNWGNTAPSAYVQLRSGSDPIKVQAKIKDFIYRYMPKEKSFITELALQPYPEKYLHSSFKNGQVDGGRIEYVRLFTIVAVFILLIACINFMNLATARSTKRAKEVGLRKVIGALRSSLIRQFIGEAILFAFLSVIVAVVVAVLLLPVFNNITGKQLFLPVAQPLFWAVLVILITVTGFVAGSYPALFLSSLNPLRILKGSLKSGKEAAFFRQGLVVFQFSLSIILIVGMIVIYQQMDYIRSKNLGYDRENLIYIPIEGELAKKYDLFKEEAGKMPGVLNISKMRNSPTVIEHHNSSISWPGKDPNITIPFADGIVGYDFVKTLKLELKDGRDFSKEFSADSANFILNETAVNRIGYKNAVGETVNWGNHSGKIIGVLKDFHFSSMHQSIDPLIIRLNEDWSYGNILVRTKAGQTKEALASLEKICKTVNPAFPFTYQFSDLEYTKMYRSEQIVSKLSNLFAFLAIFISCLGLFGLAAFTAEQRTKEIGVRKVLGASVPNILILLTTNFLKPVGIAVLIAFPVAWYAMDVWLQGFVYKIDIEWWMFALAALLTIIIAILTVSFQSIRASLINPVKSLRTE